MLNSSKTKGTLGLGLGALGHVMFGGNIIEKVLIFKFLGIITSNSLGWRDHVDYCCSKLAQRLHFLQRLGLFGVQAKIMLTFYDAVFGSLIKYAMGLVWLAYLEVQI